MHLPQGVMLTCFLGSLRLEKEKDETHKVDRNGVIFCMNSGLVYSENLAPGNHTRDGLHLMSVT